LTIQKKQYNINKIYLRRGGLIMGADCGCGGTCSVCSRVLGWQIAEHTRVIQRAVDREEPVQKEVKPKGEEKDDISHQ